MHGWLQTSPSHYFTQLEGRKPPFIAIPLLLLLAFFLLKQIFPPDLQLCNNLLQRGLCVFLIYGWGECASVSCPVGAILSLQLECKGKRKPRWNWTLSANPTAGLWNTKKYNRQHRQNVMHFLIAHCYSQIINTSYLRYWGGRPHKVRISHRQTMHSNNWKISAFSWSTGVRFR